MKKLITPRVKVFVQQTLLLALFISLLVYAILRMVFYDLPFSVWDDAWIILKTLLTGWLMLTMLKSTWHLIWYVCAKCGVVKR